MKKIRYYLGTVYRIVVLRPGGKKMVVECIGNTTPIDLIPESLLKKVIATDEPCFGSDTEVVKMLQQRVAKNSTSTLFQNAFPGFMVSLLSPRNFEFKMAFISLAFILTIGIGPSNNRTFVGNSNRFFLADTLGDTAVLNLPYLQDALENRSK